MSSGSKIRKKNYLQNILTFEDDFGCSCDEVFAPVVEAAAEPAGAAFVQGFEEAVGVGLQAEADAGLLLVERGGGHAARVEVAQGGLARDEGLQVGREPLEVVGQQAGVFRLPLVAVGRGGGGEEVRVEVRRLVEEHPEWGAR